MDVGNDLNRLYSIASESNYEAVRKSINSLKLSKQERFEWLCRACVDNQPEVARIILFNSFEHDDQCCGDDLKAENEIVKQEVEVETDDCSTSFNFKHDNRRSSQIEDIKVRIVQPMQQAEVQCDDGFPALSGFEHNNRHHCFPVTVNTALKEEAQLVQFLMQEVEVKTDDDFPASFSLEHISQYHCFQEVVNTVLKEKNHIYELLLKKAESKTDDFSSSFGLKFFGNPQIESTALKAKDELVQLLLQEAALQTDDFSSSFSIDLTIRESDAFDSLILNEGIDICCISSGQLGVIKIATAVSSEIIELRILAKKANLNSISKGSTLLHNAVEIADVKTVAFLLKQGASPNAENSEGSTPLLVAVQRGLLSIAELLIGGGADINSRAACATERDPLKQKLIEYQEREFGFCVDFLGGHSGTKKDCTPLHVAAAKGLDAMVDLFLRKGAQVDTCDSIYSTPLYLAARGGHESIVQLLLKYGADVNCVDANHQTPLHYFVVGGCVESARVVLRNGASVDFSNRQGQTPLHIAVALDYREMVTLLLLYGAKIDAKDSEGMTPLMMAASAGYVEVTKLLLGSALNIEPIQERLLVENPARINDMDAENITARSQNLIPHLSSVNSENTMGVFTDHSGVSNFLLESTTVKKPSPKFDIEDDVAVSKDATFPTTAFTNQSEASKLLPETTVGKLEEGRSLPKYKARFYVEDKEGLKALMGTLGQSETTKPLLESIVSENLESERLRSKYRAKPSPKDSKSTNYLIKATQTCHLGATKRPLESTMNGKFKMKRLLPKDEATTKARDSENSTNFMKNIISTCHLDAELIQESTARKESMNNNLRKDVSKILQESAVSEECLNELLREEVTKLQESTAKKGLTNKHSREKIYKLPKTKTSAGFIYKKESINKHTESLVREKLTNNNLRTWVTKGPESLETTQLISSRTKRRKLHFGIDCFNNRGMSALYIAAMRGHPEIVRSLLESGANVNLTDIHGDTALRVAVENSHDDVVDILLSHGAETELEYRNSLTALLTAVLSQIAGYKKYSNKQPKIVKALLAHGADINSLGGASGKTFSSLLLPIKFEPVALSTALDYGTVDGYVSESTICSVIQTVNDYDLHDNRNLHIDDVSASEVLVRHVIKMQVAGVFNGRESPVTEDFNDQSVIRRFRIGCEEELARMKFETVGDSYVRYYDLLMRNEDQLARVSKNEGIVRAVKSAGCKYPIYGGVMQNMLEKGEVRRRLVESCCEICNLLFGRDREVPYEITELILSKYFSNRDLRSLMITHKREPVSRSVET